MAKAHDPDDPPGPGQDPAFLRRLFDSLQHPFYVVDARDYTIVFANQSTTRSGDLRLGATTCYGLTHHRSTPCAGDHPCPLEEIRITGRPARTEHIHYNRDGTPYPVEVHGEPVFDEDGRLAYMMEYSLDITERKALEEDLRQAAAVFHHASEGIMITDARGRIERVNDAFTALTGYSAWETLGSRPGDLLRSGWQGPEFYRRMWQTLAEQGEWQGEIWNRRKDGSIFPEWLTISRVCDYQGEVTHYIAIFSDITEQKEAESRLRRLAYFDPLTELPNRATLEDRLNQGLARSDRGRTRIGLLFADLDGFKAINDRRGHHAGDAVLREAAQRLRGAVRGSDTVARLGGDEFVVLVEGTEGGGVATIAEKLLAAFEAPFRLPDGTPERLGLSLGIVDCTAGDDVPDDPEELIRQADRAMYAAKSLGGSTYRHAPLDRGTRGAKETPGNPLGRALAREELVLFYQPEVAVEGHRLAGLEALLRWQHPDRGLLLPGELLAEADNQGALGTLAEWTLAQACRQQREWRTERGQPGPIAVNVAPAQWRDSFTLLQTLDRVLEESGVTPGDLELEIPEFVLSEDSTRDRQTLYSLGGMGVRVTIDDFGDGAIPLSFLHLPALAKLKLSASLIERSLEPGSEAEQFLATTRTLADHLGLTVVAKGVETRAQFDHLHRGGHRAMQGFYLARPQPPHRLEPMVESGRIPEAVS